MEANTFEEVKHFLSGIDSINRGGCGVAALAMYLWLEKHNQLSADTKILYLYTYFGERSFSINERFINGKSDECAACSHAVLKHNGEIFDCEENIDPSNYIHFQEFNGIDFVRKSVKNEDAWNTWFDRRYIPIIENELSVEIL